ncbi:DEAD/DEAH box helicase [Candidatus Nitrosotenuis cloacae]|uniref:ATP-dependent DNA helicase Hel308 n=1 Tax=Candidatus Nitrosotenuis cloacae TaxID=1603555 RepID=A0A3G1B343_9ARCH|nr:DEAD/DEAH box helicase [Candidatus Nitrosotenuis cloacae]AJZ76296.1 RNA helicase [Candidatus Nitrosotenuis cloacae]
MKIADLELPISAQDLLAEQNITKLYPPQADAVKAGLLEGQNILVAAPTASGKTLVAMLAMMRFLSTKQGKVVYLTPLRALAAEKFSEFKKMEKIDLGRKIKAAISTGDFDSVDKESESADIVVLTNEKMDSIIRHGVDWIDKIGLVIADEVHLIGDKDRGPTLEVILTKLKELESKPQIVGLSATITNSDQLSEWLGCKLVLSDWRPVPLTEGVFDGGSVLWNNGDSNEIESSIRGPPIDLCLDTIKNGGQSLVFAETRTRSASLAAKGSDAVLKFLTDSEKKYLEEISQKILDNNEHTDLIKTLSTLLKKGVGFHHAGLNQNCREIIETEFRNGKIKLLASTPTLAAGVNLPARRVVISSIARYDVKEGTNKPISILEYKQLCGRAGRPQYDKFGEAIIVGNSNASDLIEYYINGTPEPIESQLTDDKALRIHILSHVVSNPGIKDEQIFEFFQKTLAGLQTRKNTLKFSIEIAKKFLIRENLIVQKAERFAATEFGKKVSMLYIDPITAIYFKRGLEAVSENKRHTLGFLHLVSSCEEFFPKFSLRNKDYETLGTLIENKSSELIESISEYDCSRSLLALHSWISESSEIHLSDNLGIESGDMHRMADTADWLVYCLYELAKLVDRADLLEELDTIRKRIAYGIKEELVELVKVRGIGRVRARKLYDHGIKTIEDLHTIPINKLAEIDKIGPTIADNIKSQLKKVR